jgi:hypothetical protein
MREHAGRDRERQQTPGYQEEGPDDCDWRMTQHITGLATGRIVV